jgi:hypothetical protein
MTNTVTTKKTCKASKNICKAANCRKQAKAKYCSTACRVASHRKADKKKSPRVVKTAIDYMEGSFWTKLFNHLGRSGTVEASPYNEGEYLDLSKLDKQCAAFNGDAGRIFELSHIVPASKGGMFNLQNLVIAPTSMNRAHGSSHFGFGEGVDLTEADPRFLITPTTPHETIKQLLIDLHGEAFMLKEAKAVKPVKSTRKADLAQVLMMFNPCNDIHVDLLKSVEFINGLTGRQMKQALEIVKGENTMPIYFAPAASTASVFISELARMAEYRPEFATISDSLTAALATQKYCASAFTPEHAKTLFNLLHGKTLAQSVIERLILENTIEMRVRYNSSFHVIDDHQSYWMQDHADNVSFVSHWVIAQDAAANLESPF